MTPTMERRPDPRSRSRETRAAEAGRAEVDRLALALIAVVESVEALAATPEADTLPASVRALAHPRGETVDWLRGLRREGRLPVDSFVTDAIAERGGRA